MSQKKHCSLRENERIFSNLDPLDLPTDPKISRLSSEGGIGLPCRLNPSFNSISFGNQNAIRLAESNDILVRASLMQRQCADFMTSFNRVAFSLPPFRNPAIRFNEMGVFERTPWPQLPPMSLPCLVPVNSSHSHSIAQSRMSLHGLQMGQIAPQSLISPILSHDSNQTSVSLPTVPSASLTLPLVRSPQNQRQCVIQYPKNVFHSTSVSPSASAGTTSAHDLEQVSPSSCDESVSSPECTIVFQDVNQSSLVSSISLDKKGGQRARLLNSQTQTDSDEDCCN